MQRLCYPLWDAGLTVGYAVRTPADAVRAAADRLETATALTDRRLVAGESGLLDDLASRAGRWLRRHAARLLGDLAAVDRERRVRAGWRPGMLEPHLKDGAGGLRDLQGLRWAAACLVGEVGLDALVGAHYLGAGTRRELAAAYTDVLTARCALQLVRLDHGGGRIPAKGGDVDRLRLDLQDDVAARLGVEDGDALLRRVGLATRTIGYASERTWPQLLDDAGGGRRWLRAPFRPSRGRRDAGDDALGPGLSLRDGAVAIDEGATIAAEPALAFRALAAAAGLAIWLHRPSAERLRREIAAAGTLPWDGPARDALLAVLRAGPSALPALGDADALGLFEAYLPGWSRVRGRPQRNPFHRYDLDTHLCQTVVELVELGGGGLTEREALLFDGLGDPDTLVLTAFLHDIGKAWPGDHSVVGADLAADWVVAMGFDKRRADRVAHLIRHHLLLFDAATRRDLDDHDELAAVAEAAGDVETLDGLYLLTLADARATGPTAHSPWKDGLLAELHRRVRALLDGGAAPVVPRAGDIVAAATSSGVDGVGELLPRVTERYLVTAGTDQVLAHAALLDGRVPDPGELRAAVRPGPARGTATLSVVAADHRGLMADCAGVLAASGLGVLDARAFTTGDGVALDWFVVSGDGGDWDAVVTRLARAAAGHLDVAAAVAERERRRGEAPPPLAAPIPVDVRFDVRPGVSGPGLSRVEVHGPDASGLLYRLATTLAQHGVDVLGARVATLGPAVRDTFFVHFDHDPDRQAALALALREAARS